VGYPKTGVIVGLNRMRKLTTAVITICDHTYDQYLDMVRAFHKHIAPGVVLGGLMVDLAYRSFPQGDIFDTISETRSCVPDAIQILTPCPVGNGWLVHIAIMNNPQKGGALWLEPVTDKEYNNLK